MARHMDKTAGAALGEAPVARAFVAVADAQGWSPAVIHKRLADFYDEVGPDLEEVDYDVIPSEATIRRIRANVSIPTKDFAWFIEKWLSANFPDELEKERRLEDQPFVASCRALFGRSPDPMPDKMEKFSGHYELYRPFHLKPRTKIIIERLSIGENGNPFSCHLSSRFPHITDDDGTDSVGLCVPHGRKLMAVMTVESDTYSQIIIYFDRVHSKNHRRDSTDPTVIAMTGIMVASVGDADDASAWPVYLQRVKSKSDVDCRVIDGLDIAALPDLAQRSLQRGAVYWDARDYVHPFGRFV